MILILRTILDLHFQINWLLSGSTQPFYQAEKEPTRVLILRKEPRAPMQSQIPILRRIRPKRRRDVPARPGGRRPLVAIEKRQAAEVAVRDLAVEMAEKRFRE